MQEVRRTTVRWSLLSRCARYASRGFGRPNNFARRRIEDAFFLNSRLGKFYRASLLPLDTIGDLTAVDNLLRCARIGMKSLRVGLTTSAQYFDSHHEPHTQSWAGLIWNLRAVPMEVLQERCGKVAAKG